MTKEDELLLSNVARTECLLRALKVWSVVICGSSKVMIRRSPDHSWEEHDSLASYCDNAIRSRVLDADARALEVAELRAIAEEMEAK